MMLSNAYLAIRPFRVCLLTSALAIAGAGVTGPAVASTPYDGSWSVVIVTRTGACEPTVRYGVEISNGAVVNSTGNNQADVSGQVTRRGIVRSSSAPAAGGPTVPDASACLAAAACGKAKGRAAPAKARGRRSGGDPAKPRTQDRSTATRRERKRPARSSPASPPANALSRTIRQRELTLATTVCGIRVADMKRHPPPARA